MIFRLVREQLRSQWRYAAWSAGLLAVALALATFTAATAATVIRQQDSTRDLYLYGRDHVQNFVSFTNGRPADQNTRGIGKEISFTDLDALIATAGREGSITAGREFWALPPTGGSEGIPMAALATTLDWDRYLLAGHAPGPGEVVLTAETARRFGLGLGDVWAPRSDYRGARSAPMSLTVSGLLRDGTVEPYWVSTYSAYISWADSVEAASAFQPWTFDDGDGGEPTSAIATVATWDDGNNAMFPYEDGNDYFSSLGHGFAFTRFFGNIGYVESWALGISALTLVSLVIAAFGMGRAQGEARTRWTATARVLGATRRTVALASLTETAALAALGITAGLGLGYLGEVFSLARLRASHPESLIPSGVSLPAAVVIAVVGAGFVISTVLAAVPAFWASRVAPAAALKPVTPVGEATVSRRVSRWWLIGLLAGLALVDLATFTISERATSGGDWAYIAVSLALVATLVVGFASLVDGLREILPRVAERLGRLRWPWAVAAGDSLRSHRRIFTYASVSMALAVGTIVAVATESAIGAIDYDHWKGWGEPPMIGFAAYVDWIVDPGFLWAVVGIFGTATLIAAVVTLSSRSSLDADAATRSALGLSRNNETLAAAARQWTPMVVGIVVGGVLGWLLPLGIRALAAVASPNALVHSGQWNLTVSGYSVVSAAFVVALALAISLAGSLAVGLLARPRTPVDALRRAVG